MKKPPRSKQAVLLFQVRPIPPPSYWPTKHGGWVTVHPDGSGWTSGSAPEHGLAISSPHLAEQLGNLVIAWFGENPDEWVMRLRQGMVNSKGKWTFTW